MKCVKILILMVMMSGIYTVGAAQGLGAAQELNVLPKPCSVRITDTDGRFQIHRGAGVYAENADAMLAAEYLQNYCSEYLGLPLRIVKSKGEAAIHILTDDFGGKARDGQYSLAVTSDGVTITGAKRSPEACFLGVTTLVQMLPTRWRHSPAAAGGDYRLSTVWLSWYAPRRGASLFPGVVCEEIY